MANELKFAVLIDADNISDKYIKIILDEITNEGVATYKRIYGDWTNPALASWKTVLLDNSILPMQQYGYTSGKNSTDSAMIIDAMDILYSGQVNGFCIVSSDSDFTRLAARLRESAMQVIGMGERKTPKPFIAACNQFKYLDVLWASTQNIGNPVAPLMAQTTTHTVSPVAAKSTVSEEMLPLTDIDTIKAAIETIVKDGSDEDGWVFGGQLGALLVKRYPDFDVRNYGFSKITPFIKSLGQYEIKSIAKGNNKLVYIRKKGTSD